MILKSKHVDIQLTEVVGHSLSMRVLRQDIRTVGIWAEEGDFSIQCRYNPELDNNKLWVRGSETGLDEYESYLSFANDTRRREYLDKLKTVWDRLPKGRKWKGVELGYSSGS